jgi:predicted RNase H-like HicB family nuclease
MAEYALYLESGPKRRKTMVHVLDLLGCVAVGPTTDAALEATPHAIRRYLSFFQRHGENLDPDEPFTTRVAEHLTEGIWLGNGSPYVVYAPDLEPVSQQDIETWVRRFAATREELASWAEKQTDAQLDAPADGRTSRAVLLHVMGGPGSYLSASVGGASGFSRIVTAAERGQIEIPDAVRQVAAKAVELLESTTPEQRSAVIETPSQVKTLRKSVRRMLEHDWEHLAELARRPGGSL